MRNKQDKQIKADKQTLSHQRDGEKNNVRLFCTPIWSRMLLEWWMMSP